MSLITKLFGGKKGEQALTPQEAIQKLRETEEMLTKKSDYLEKQIEQELTKAKQNSRKNKRVAIQALKHKKRYEKQLQQIDGTLSTIELQRESLENASTNTEVLNVMQSSAKALKAAHKNMDVDDVLELTDEIAEQQEVAREISDAISNPTGFGQDVDDDELMAELEGLEQEALDADFLNVGPMAPAELPSVPTSEPASAASAKTKMEDDDLKELEMWAS